MTDSPQEPLPPAEPETLAEHLEVEAEIRRKLEADGWTFCGYNPPPSPPNFSIITAPRFHSNVGVSPNVTSEEAEAIRGRRRGQD